MPARSCFRVARATMSELVSLYAAMAPRETFAPPPDLGAIASAAHAQGYAQGEAAAAAALAPQCTLLATLGEALEAACTIDAVILREPFVQLVTSLAEAVVMAELTLSPAVILRLVDAALASVAVAEAVTVRLHPDDVAAVTGLSVVVVGDPELARGSVAVEGAKFVVHDGLPARLAVALAAL